MRFCTDAYGYTKYVNGKTFPLWNNVPEGDFNHESFIKKFCYENLYVNDADNSGCETIYFRFSDNTYYKVEHSWWWEYGEDDYSNLRNEFLLDKVTVDVLPTYMSVEDRDWIVY